MKTPNSKNVTSTPCIVPTEKPELALLLMLLFYDTLDSNQEGHLEKCELKQIEMRLYLMHYESHL